MRRASVFAVLLAAFAACFAGPAAAASLYAVSGVKVDVAAANAAEARTAGFAQAQAMAFARLVKRLTLPEDIAAKGQPQLAPAALDALVASVQIEQERPLGAHYSGQLTVNFEAAGVRQALRAQGLTLIETRAAPVLVVAQAPGAPAAFAESWRAAWANGGYGNDLVPIAAAPPGLTGAPDWAQSAQAAAAAGAARALYASARRTGGAVAADLVEVDANGQRRVLGAVTAPGGDGAALAALADAADGAIQDEWKRSLAGGAGQRQRVTASAIYASQAEWARLRRGLEGAARTVVSGVSIDAVSKNAAMVSFAYVGGRDQLAAELRRNGVALQEGGQGLVLKLAPGGA